MSSKASLALRLATLLSAVILCAAAPDTGGVWSISDVDSRLLVTSTSEDMPHLFMLTCDSNLPDVYDFYLEVDASDLTDSQIASALEGVHGMLLAPHSGVTEEVVVMVVSDGGAQRNDEDMLVGAKVPRKALARAVRGGDALLLRVVAGKTWVNTIGTDLAFPARGLSAALQKLDSNCRAGASVSPEPKDLQPTGPKRRI